jgi:hypothetical protein
MVWAANGAPTQQVKVPVVIHLCKGANGRRGEVGEGGDGRSGVREGKEGPHTHARTSRHAKDRVGAPLDASSALAGKSPAGLVLAASLSRMDVNRRGTMPASDVPALPMTVWDLPELVTPKVSKTEDWPATRLSTRGWARASNACAGKCDAAQICSSPPSPTPSLPCQSQEEQTVAN